MYKIMANYRPGPHGPETVDTAETLEDARFLYAEYRLAYDNDTDVWVETVKGERIDVSHNGVEQ